MARILIVDDSPSQLLGIQRIVEKLGHEFITAEDGAAGVEVGFGSEVTLWGRAQNGALLAIDEVAQAAGTVGYELMCALAPRVPTAVD